MFDPFGIQSQMNSMMRGFMVDPFGQQQQRQPQQPVNNGRNSNNNNRQLALSPFDRHNQMMTMHHDPFAMMNSMMSNMHNMSMFGNQRNNIFDQHFVSTDPHAQVFSSSSVVTYSNSGDGKPKVYQESKQMRQGPGGVKETRELVRDSSKGLEKVAIGHHIGERAHIIERQKTNNGPIEEIVNLENLDDDEVNEFNQEFETKLSHHARSFNSHSQHRSHHLNNNHPLAIEDVTRPKKEKDRKSKSKANKH